MQFSKIVVSLYNFFYKPSNVKQIEKLNHKCNRVIEPIKNSTNSEKRFRIREVLHIKNGAFDLFKKDSQRLIKQKIVKQILELTLAYAHLLENYYVRLNDFEKVNINEIKIRINKNEEKLNNMGIIDDENKILEMIKIDKELFDMFQEEEKSLQNINDKLTYIESTASILKQQMLADIDGEVLLEKIQDTVNEAKALNTTLRENQRQKV